MHSNFIQQVLYMRAIIMDGNGRWALARASKGGRTPRGVETVSRIVEAAPELGIGVLTLFAFSSDNWRRLRRKWMR